MTHDEAMVAPAGWELETHLFGALGGDSAKWPYGQFVPGASHYTDIALSPLEARWPKAKWMADYDDEGYSFSFIMPDGTVIPDTYAPTLPLALVRAMLGRANQEKKT